MGDKRSVTRRGFLAFLTAAAASLGAVGAGLSAVPFIRAMSPTRDLLATGVMEVEIGDVAEGGLKTVLWRKQPVFIVRRTMEMIRSAGELDPEALADPATPRERSKRPDLFVAIGICTHLGCIPRFMPEGLPGLATPGFYCPCHGGKYDTLGRRLGGPPPENLHLVPYEIVSDTRLVIGTETFSGYGENVRKVEDLPGA
ncbi:MAG: ubiquinol-cytochrome c reductase iron-sulfur subunit [Thermodesulfobacteriota bacterium]